MFTFHSPKEPFQNSDTAEKDKINEQCYKVDIPVRHLGRTILTSLLRMKSSISHVRALLTIYIPSPTCIRITRFTLIIKCPFGSSLKRATIVNGHVIQRGFSPNFFPEAVPVIYSYDTG